MPEGVTAPVQSGPRLAATAVCLQNFQFLPEARTAEVFRELCGVSLCTGTLTRLRRRAAHNWESWVARLCEHWGRCPGVQHLAETGFRIAGQGQWL